MNIRVLFMSICAFLMASGFTGILSSTANAAGYEVTPNLVTAVRQATNKYHNIGAAMADGYASALNCVSGENEGAMGVHYVNSGLIGDGLVEAQHPEILVYAPTRHGDLRLVAVEYLTLAPVWDAAHPGTPPVLMGQLFDFHGTPNRYALPAIYGLHVWAWKHNPRGTFAEWNPTVSCVNYSGS